MTPDTPRIHRLSSALANQIAAGEVVERPASIVKELVENSLDAGADRIDIQVSRGGLESIRVTDNGCGIHPDDMLLALDRHATSKVRVQEDLDGIASYGFRGEALPSISSVAGLTLTSRLRGSAAALRVQCSPGESVPQPVPAAAPDGTTVEVTSLFDRVPARRKFLKTERTEYLHVFDTAKRLALGSPRIDMRFSHNGRRVLHCPRAADPGDRVQDIMGRRFGAAALHVERESHGMRLRAWLSPADLSRSQSDAQFLYLNGRMIRDRQVSHAVRMAYADRVATGRYPLYVVYLEMDPALADVNVHPTKHEVRFRRARDVHDFVLGTLADALAADGSFAGLPPPVPGSPRAAAVPGVRERDARAPVPAAPPSGLGRPVLQPGGGLVITERDDSMVLVDMLAAARLCLRSRLAAERRSGSLRQRPLLVPVELEAGADCAAALARAADRLREWGLRLECAGTSIRVRTVPVLLEAADLHRLVPALGDAVSDRQPRERLLEVLVEHGVAAPAAVRLAELCRCLEELDLDLAAPDHPGVWRTLRPGELRSLLGERG